MIGPSKRIWLFLPLSCLILLFGIADAQQTPPPAAENPYLMGSEGYDKGPRGLTSYMPIAIDQPFAARMAQDVAAKPGIEREHQAMLEERYDLSDHPAQGVTMERGKPLQEGVRVKLPPGVTWEQLAAMTPDEIRDRGLWPKGFLPLPHPIPSHRRLCVSAGRDRRDQAPGRARPDPLRHRFRPAGALPGRVSAGHVPDRAPRSGGCLAGQAGLRSPTTSSCSTALSRRGSWKGCACW